MTAADPGRRSKTRILIVDDHPVLRRGLASLIESEPDLAVCGEAASCEAALAAIRKNSPDLVIVDLELNGCDGLHLVRDMKKRYSNIPALVLSVHDETTYGERALRAGARGYLSKQQLDDTVLAAIRSLLAGKMFLTRRLQARLASKFLSGHTLEAGSNLDLLSDRELEVFRWIGRGRSTRQIAEKLHLSVKTVESHREHIKHKLAIETAAELARRATQWVETGRTA